MFDILLVVLAVVFVWWLGILQLGIYLVQVKRVPRPQLFKQSGDGPKLLIVGESIALGYGVEDARDGFAGLIGRAFPSASIEVIALPFKGTGRLLKELSHAERYDVVILTTSGNDLMNPRQKVLADSLREMVRKCLLITDHVVVLGNFDNLYRARYFSGAWWFKPLPLLLQVFFRWQSTRVGQTYRNVLSAMRLSNHLVEVRVPMAIADTSFDGIHPGRIGHIYFVTPIIKKLKELNLS